MDQAKLPFIVAREGIQVLHVLSLGIWYVISGGVDGIKPFQHDPPCIHVRIVVLEFYTEVVFVAGFNIGGAFS